jgi:hypothetical protein
VYFTRGSSRVLWSHGLYTFSRSYTNSLVGIEFKKIKKTWSDTGKEEIERLQTRGILTEKILEKIERVFQNSNYSWKDFNTFKILIGRALEIRSHYRKTHYIFTHAQSTKRYVMSCLMKELIRRQSPSEKMHQFKPLHLPTISARFSATLNFFNRKKKLPFYQDDHSLSGNLLSADAFFWNSEVGDSALHFLMFNKNISDCIPFMPFFKAQLEGILLDAQISKQLHPQIASTLEKISQICDKSNSFSNLFVICIPKEKFNKTPSLFGYRSHPGGMVCECTQEGELEVLEKLQRDDLDKSSYCHIGQTYFVPQYRLFSHTLQPRNGVSTFLVSPLPKKFRQEIKEKVGACLDTFKI